MGVSVAGLDSRRRELTVSKRTRLLVLGSSVRVLRFVVVSATCWRWSLEGRRGLPFLM